MNRILPPTYFLAGVLLMVALNVVVPVTILLAFPWSLVGLVPLSAGLVLNILADRAFTRHQTTVKPFEVSTALMTRGVFAISRNPMCRGMTLALAGIAILLRSASPWLVAPAFPVMLQTVFITREEAMLEEAFGDRFREYGKKVRRGSKTSVAPVVTALIQATLIWPSMTDGGAQTRYPSKP